MTGKAALEFSDSSKMHPRVVFDGEQFSVTWHTQPMIISSLNGDLRLARVALSGKANSTDGKILGKDDGQLHHALLGSTGELVLVHKTGSTVRRLIMSPNGVQGPLHRINGSYSLAAIATHPDGHALLMVQAPGLPKTTIFGRNGGLKAGDSLITAQIVASVWLGHRPDGTYAAMLQSTNKNASIYLREKNLIKKNQHGVGHGALIRSASMTVADQTLATLYITHKNMAELELYDSKGKEQKRVILGQTTPDVHIAGQTSLTWTGQQLVGLYPTRAPGQYRLRLMEKDGKMTGGAIELPNCLAVAGSQTSLAWGNGHLAVATVNSASGVQKSAVCVVVMKCIQ